jgi:hypothetical protein
MNDEAEPRDVEAPFGRLERTLIYEFIRARGYDSTGLADLPEEQREHLLADASIYASGKLMEVEARSHFLNEIHDGSCGAS